MENIIKFVQNEMKNDKTGHDFNHALRVVNNAKKIMQQEGGNEKIIITACFIHDTIDEKLFENVKIQINKIITLLKEEQYSPNEIEEIIFIITNMSFHKQIKNDNLNFQIVQDADKLDALGSIGIIRTIQYGTTKSRLFYEEENLKNINGKLFFNKSTETTLSHFYDKLLKLPMLMNTKTGKSIAVKRALIMNDFLDNFYQELEN